MTTSTGLFLPSPKYVQEISSVACIADKEDGSEPEYWEWAGGGDSYGSPCAEQVGDDINQVDWTDDDYQYLE